ncbi:MAG: hypothetical protein Q8S13_11365 [Dehalococcoidia bacterium]|nr:hypothetical protein [Dehalococcoidia bacterium]
MNPPAIAPEERIAMLTAEIERLVSERDTALAKVHAYRRAVSAFALRAEKADPYTGPREVDAADIGRAR